jgi:ribosomal protein L16 Arg81 hydroxylase
MPVAIIARLTISFADLVAPLDPQVFLSQFWTRRAAHLKTESRTFDPYFGWAALNSVLNCADLVFPKLVMSRRDRPIPQNEFTLPDGSTVDAQAVTTLFRDGATFRMSAAESHWAPLRAITNCLYDVLLESVHANVYCSPANTQGFQCHYDLHEVFVLQIDGTKRWRVYHPTTEFPVDGWRPEDAPHESTEPYVDVVLRQGDVLYVPRGHWHYAIAEDSPSLHITVGVASRRGSHFLDWLSSELMRDGRWRRNAPLMNVASAHGGRLPPPGFSEWSDGLKDSLIEMISAPDLFERFYKDTLAGIRPVQRVELPLLGMADRLPIETIVFERPAARPYLIDVVDESTAVVTVPGCEMRLEGLAPALIRKIFESASFTLADVRSWDPLAPAEDVSDLLVELLHAGLLAGRAG